MKRLLILAVVLAALLSFWLVSLASGTETPMNICIDLEKTGPEIAMPGETIAYHFWVHNCGDIPFLSHARVVDLLIDPWRMLWEGDLYPGDVAEFDRTYTLPNDYCGGFTNNAWAKGYPVLDGTPLPEVRDDDSWTVEIFCAPGTGTPGYWMNHPEAWPVGGIEIGDMPYTKDEAIGFMKDPVKGDKTFTMFPALVAAKLNVLIGNDDSCIAEIISAADEWMAIYPVGSDVAAKGKDSPWREGEPLYKELDEYNNGEAVCVSSRDDLK